MSERIKCEICGRETAGYEAKYSFLLYGLNKAEFGRKLEIPVCVTGRNEKCALEAEKRGYHALKDRKGNSLYAR